MTDDQLVLAYVKEGSQSAFAELVRRYLSLVCSAAKRQTGDASLAQDISQQVFTVLARKTGKLNSDVVLSGWLYRTTCHVAARTLRGEHRRRAREQTAIVNMNDPECDPLWRQIEPLLDQAMATLNRRDRDAVVLRYFENKSLREVGVALGTNDDAAQKRLSRAVEKLRAFFARKGHTVSAGSLTTVLVAGAVQAAPATLVTTVSTAALASASATSLGIFGLMSSSTIKSLAAVTGCLAAGVLGYYQYNQISRLRAQNSALQTQLDVAQRQVAANELAGARAAAPIDPDPELLRLRAEVARLRGVEAELKRGQMQQRPIVGAVAPQGPEKPLATDEQRRTRTTRTMMRTVLAMLSLAQEVKNKTQQAELQFLTDDGQLSPELRARCAKYLQEDPDSDGDTTPRWDDIELLVTGSGAILKMDPDTIVARSKPMQTPEGKWGRVYALADGSAHWLTHNTPDEIWDGSPLR